MSSALGPRIVSLWDMQKIGVAELMYAFGQIERIEVLVSPAAPPFTKGVGDDAALNLRNHVARHYLALGTAAKIAGAPLTELAADRAVKRLRAKGKPLTFGQLAEINKDLSSRLEDEVGAIEFYCLKKGAGEFYTPEEPLFGREVAARIGRSADDISESGKCFAVGRYTASVFHLMRAMEAAVQVISERLGIPNVEREWGKLLSDINGKIEGIPKGAERNEWSQAHANLYHVKQAWRNETMHPKATYTEEEAREVFDAMKAFMRHLASMLPMTLEEALS